MNRPLLPPRGIFLTTRVLFDRRMKPALRDTLLQMMALAWSSPEHITPPITWTILESLTGKPARTLRAHIAALRNRYAALRLRRAAGGHFFLTFAGWLYQSDVETAICGEFLPQPRGENLPEAGGEIPPKRPGGEFLPRSGGEYLPKPVKEEEELNININNQEILPPPDSCSDPARQEFARRKNAQSRAGQQSAVGETARRETGRQETAPLRGYAISTAPSVIPSAPAGTPGGGGRPGAGGKPAGRAPAGKPAPANTPDPLDGEVRDALVQAGVFPSLLGEIARRAQAAGYTGDDLLALLDWCRDERPDQPAALFVARLRAGARAPQSYQEPACPRCGERGKHSRECPRRYLET